MRRVPCSFLLIAAVLAGGCSGGPPAGPGDPRPDLAEPVAPITSTDPCATRLHDIAGALLLYYVRERSLPVDLAQIRGVPGGAQIGDLACPVSGKPYIFNPKGLVAPNQQGRVILYDAAPSHSGMRWGISIVEPAGPGPLITKVIALPESFFATAKPPEPEPAE